MRMSTRNDLLFLAKKMVEEFDVEKVIGSNDFMLIALDVAEESGIPLSKQTLSKYESELKRICKSMMLDTKHEFIEELPERKLKMTIHYYDDGSYEVVKPEKRSEVVERPIPNWTMFAEGEDGLIILKGTYKGKTIDEIDQIAGFEGASKGWSKWCLKNDKDLTEDDRFIFNKIIDGTL